MMADVAPASAFRFGTTWELPAGPGQVFDALSALGDYPAWWPQVTCVAVHPDRTCQVEVRSFLPRVLTVTLSPRTADQVSHRLGIWITGDMQGWAQWLLSPGTDPGTTTARYHHEVKVAASRWRTQLLGVPMRMNHAWLFRQGCRGLRHHLGQGSVC